MRHGLRFSGFTKDRTMMEILELPGKFFFLGTQFHPEFKSRPGRLDPAYYGLVKTALDRKLGREKVDLGKPFSYAAASKY